MSIRITSMLAVAAVMSLGVAACTKAETHKAEVHAENAGETAKAAAADAGAAVKSGAAQAGEVVEGGAMKAAQAVENVSGDAARKLEQKQAEAAAQGKPGAINPATDKRVPAN